MKNPRTFSKRFIPSTAMSEVNASAIGRFKKTVKVSAWGAKHFFGLSVLRSYSGALTSLMELSQTSKTQREKSNSYLLCCAWRHTLCDRMRNIWQYISKTFLQLARDEYSRPVLVANLIAHAMTISFLFALGWTLYGH